MIKIIQNNKQVDTFGSFEEYQEYTNKEIFTSITFNDLLFDYEQITLDYADIKSIILKSNNTKSIIINNDGLWYEAIDIVVNVA